MININQSLEDAEVDRLVHSASVAMVMFQNLEVEYAKYRAAGGKQKFADFCGMPEDEVPEYLVKVDETIASLERVRLLFGA